MNFLTQITKENRNVKEATKSEQSTGVSLAQFHRSVFDATEIMLDIVHGEGGDDSKIFVEELFSAYLKYARNLNLNSELLHSAEGHMMAKITGKGAGRAFQHESGKHCVQRIPPTESKGRKQTSMVSVAVLPIPKNIEVSIPDSDLKITTQRGHGKGGQHQNTTDSAVRMVHIPTGISVFINGREQLANKREALRIISARVEQKTRADEQSKHNKERQTQMDGGGRGNKVRTYNFMENKICDHNLNKKTGNVKAFMKGQFDVLFGG